MMLLATCCTFAALSMPARATPHPGWEPLVDGSRTGVEIDRSRIARDRGFVDVWVRTRADRESVAREFEAAGVAAHDVARVRASFHHSEHLWSFFCDDGTHALAYSAYYANDGSLIRSFEVGQRTYWPVQPDTVGQRLLSTACKPSNVAGANGPDERIEEDSAATTP